MAYNYWQQHQSKVDPVFIRCGELFRAVVMYATSLIQTNHFHVSTATVSVAMVRKNIDINVTYFTTPTSGKNSQIL